MKSLVVFALVAGLGAAEAGAAPQQPNQAAATSAPARPVAPAQPVGADRRKAQLLTAMARWVRQYGEPAKQPLPALDSGSVAGFQRSVQAQADLRDLTERVRKKISGQSFEGAPLQQVADAIGLVVKDKYGPRPAAAARLPALTAALTRVVAAKAVVPADSASGVGTAAVASDTAAAVAGGPRNGPSDPVAAAAAESTTAAATDPMTAGGIGFIAGLVAGAVGCWFFLSQRVQQERTKIRGAVNREYESVMKQANSMIQSLERDKKDLEDRLRRAGGSAPVNRLRSKPAEPVPADPLPEPSEPLSVAALAGPEPDPAPDRIVELSVAHMPTGPERYYAPAPDVPYIEHRKLSREPFDVMPIRLVVPDGPTGTLATYGFSPEADQTRILADGVRNLRAFFEFELPPTEQFSRISTATPGRLERVGDRWEVREKARLDIS